MSPKNPKCPVCGQALSDPSIEARVRHNLEKLDAERAATFKRKVALIRREADAKARNNYETRLKEAALRARADEREKNDRDRNRLLRQVEHLERQLEQMSNDKRGDIAEAEILDLLERAFPADRMRRLDKSRGSADILHEIREHGRTCGSIVYEVKNTAKWSGATITQARSSMAFHQASHVIVVSNVFPAKQQHLAVVKDVFVALPSVVVGVVRALRQAIVIRAGTQGSSADRERRADHLLVLVKSEDFQRRMKAVADAVAQLQELQAKERQMHSRIWDQETALHRSIEESHAVVQSRIEQVTLGTALSVLEPGDDTKAAVG